MIKKLLPIFLFLSILLLPSCGSGKTDLTSPDDLEDTMANTPVSTESTSAPSSLQTTQTTSAVQEPSPAFRTLENSTIRGLYYIDYTEDYKFDEFISQGGAASTSELVQYAYKSFPNIKLDLSALGYGCSSFCTQSSDGDTIFGRNFDMDSNHSESYLIVHTKPENGYESYSTVNLKFIGITIPKNPIDDTSPLLLTPYIPHDGINSAGLAICVLQLDFSEIHESGANVDMTSTTIIRNVLDNAKNVDEAIEIFKNCNLNTDGYAYHYMVGEASGKSAVIEFVDNEIIVEYKTDDIQVCANTYVTDEGIAFYKDANSADSINRMNAIINSAKASNFNMTVENAFSALKAASNSNTRWSIVYNLTDKTMDIAINANFNKNFSFSFEN